MNPKDLIDAARKIIEDRQESHGEPSKNISLIADLWTQYLGVNITPPDVCLMMVLLKIARSRAGKPVDDHFVDMIGYAALAGGFHMPQTWTKSDGTKAKQAYKVDLAAAEAKLKELYLESYNASVAEQADAGDLKSSDASRAGSTPAAGTIHANHDTAASTWCHTCNAPVLS